ncbi:MAG: hypothetical protein IME94_01620, partial [Proteobacteria bacterium]|nr:hypothetical protein [Pseudomonadota bacterium]
MKKQTHQIPGKSMVLKPFLFLATIGLSNSAYPAPGNLADTPLFIASHVQPNITILLDDSGSMGWGELLNTGAAYGSWPYEDEHTDDLPPSNDDDEFNRGLRRLTCPGFNLLAYDPNVAYTPWKGKDSSGDFFTDRTLTTACDNPYDSCGEDVSDHYFWLWNDDGDGEYDGPGSSGQGAAADAATDECGDVSSNSGGVAVNSLTTDAERMNYANWYSYYRLREYTAKKAVAEVINSSTARVGLYGINYITGNDTDGPINTPVADLADTNDTIPANGNGIADGEDNRNTLFTNLFTGSSDGFTPLRTALEDVGDILEGGSSPINNKCQANYTLLMTDGYWNGSDPTLGDTDSDDNTNYDGGSYADSVRYCHIIDTTHCVTQGVYDTFTNNNDDTYLDQRDYTEINDISNTLADVAMYFYERDLATTLDNEVPTDRALDDTNPAQHMNTYTLSFGLDGTLSANPTSFIDPFLWPIPTPNAITTIDDLRHAAWNGRGQYLSAKKPQEMIDALNAAFLSFETKSSAASVAFNSKSLGTNSFLYLAIFDSSDWSGDLIAYALDPTNGNIASTASWHAASVLNNELSTQTGLDNRVIVSGKRDN